MDDDIIVQGDILALYNTPLKPGHAAAFSEDCDSASTKVIIRGAGNQVNSLLEPCRHSTPYRAD
ncbi:glycosyltransferase 8 domain containing 1 [Phyllostomus discolor]|uniref:Glycosyltransferase 8 domain containing 1 n=1 Tax=Phyllostomus discolor TaxID=89673 RepID=A0A833ZYE9_9CHIR|nr:glycosyltransferase 8 domain containing 1 [Phyllostomus discolor]